MASTYTKFILSGWSDIYESNARTLTTESLLL